MGCRDGNELLNMPDSFNGTRLKPFTPNPSSACPKTTIVSTITPPYYSYTHNTNLVALNFHQAKQSKIEFNEQPLGSSRWNPTPEQLLALEEMYRRGIRTPSSEQIQQIATQLSRFGRIEGKNVFYWFQNHKARERQKRRRQMETDTEEKQHDIEILEKKESGLRRTGYEVEQSKNWVSPSNCSGLPEEYVAIHRASLAESETCGWTRYEEKELQLRKGIVERHATWQLMHLSCTPPHLINTMTTTSLDTKLLNTQNLVSLLKPNRENYSTDLEDETRETQTLELFPLRSDDDRDGINVTKKDTKVPITTINTDITPNKFFEFLPLKN